MTRWLVLPLVVLVAALVGCANPFTEHYVNRLGVKSVAEVPGLIAGQGTPGLVRTQNPQETARQLLEDGYVLVGYSVFADEGLNESLALEQGRKVKAELVALGRFFVGTDTRLEPVPAYYETGVFAEVYGPLGPRLVPVGGVGMGSGTGVTTAYVPVAVNRYYYDASFWVRRQSVEFGAIVSDLPPELRMRLGRNTGVVVRVVVRNSPAWEAGVLPGDVIVALGTTEVKDAGGYQVLLPALAGQSVEIRLIRLAPGPATQPAGERVLPVKMGVAAAPASAAVVVPSR